MTVLIVGASGATGRLLVEQLLEQGATVKAIVRNSSSLPDKLVNHENLTVIRASILEIGADELAQIVKDCDAVASCLGHNLTFKGLFGHPRRLVTESVSRLCNAIKTIKSDRVVRFILMNTSGNNNRDINEPTNFMHKCVVGLLRLLLPPHVDNEKAADYLRTEIGQNDPAIKWVAVRPDGLIDESNVTEYEEYPSPIRDAIFNPGQTSRINVAHFMMSLITDNDKFAQWTGQMPVIYNKEDSSK